MRLSTTLWIKPKELLWYLLKTKHQKNQVYWIREFNYNINSWVEVEEKR